MTKLSSINRGHHSTRSELNELRNNGKVPAVVYGYQVDNTTLSVEENEFLKVIREVGRNGVIDLNLGEKPVKVMVTDYQYDSLKNQVTHIDFVAINMKSEVTVEVTVELLGEAKGTDEGGIVEQPTFQLEVTATPDNIPENLQVDVSELEIGDTLYVSDIKIDGNFTIENDAEEPVVTVVPPQKEVVEDEETEMAEEGEEETDEESSEEDEEN